MSRLVAWIWRWCHPAFFKKGKQIPVTGLDIHLKIHWLAWVHLNRILVNDYVVLRILKHVHFKSEVTNAITYKIITFVVMLTLE